MGKNVNFVTNVHLGASPQYDTNVEIEFFELFLHQLSVYIKCRQAPRSTSVAECKCIGNKL